LKYIPCKSAISRSSLPGLKYTFNPYIGCRHGCLYCYVPDVLRWRVSKSGWGEYAYVKEGILDRLRADLRRYPPGLIGVSTVTDPYQPIERELELTRQALTIIGSAGFTASIQTKSPLVSRDLDVIRIHKFELGMTITSLDDGFQRRFEPGASPPEERAQVLEEASSMDIKTWIFYGPIIPGHNDSEGEMAAIVGLAKRTKSSILYDRLNLKPLMRIRLKGVLTPDGLRAVGEVDFTKIYYRLEALCRERGVKARYAF
jgi:DNA repair photolyase